jgi:hypothetical protein
MTTEIIPKTNHNPFIKPNAICPFDIFKGINIRWLSSSSLKRWF